MTPDFVTFAVGNGGEVATSLATPPAPALVGMQFYHQLHPIEVDPARNIQAVAASNVLRATIGSW